MTVERWAAGGRLVKVVLGRSGKKVSLRFRKFKPLVDEVKCMRGAEWDPRKKHWLVTECRRNRMQMDAVAGRPVAEVVRYGLPPGGTPRRGNLKPHQVDMFRWMHSVRRGILAAEMGTMKTLPTIEEMEQAGGEWWYVSKPKVLTSIKIEFAKWRAKITPRWISINGLHRVLEGHDGPAPRGVVFDEGSFLKGKGPWYQAAQHLADAMREEHGDECWVLILTGTPAPKDPTDWHSLAEVCCPGYLRESTKPHLTRRLAHMEKMQLEDRFIWHPVGWKPDEVRLLGERLSGLAYVVYSKDCQALPEMRIEYVHLKPAPDVLRAARLAADGALTAASALDKVRQVSDGFLYEKTGPKTKVAHRVACPKDDALRTHLARNEEVGRTIVYAPYRESIDRVVDVCRGEGWDVLRCDGRGWTCLLHDSERPGRDEETVQAWLKEMDRSLDTGGLAKLAFVGHPGSGGFGLNLTAAREGVHYSCDFDQGAHAQSLKRPHREGMDLQRGFTWYYLCHLPTDEYVLKNHEGKRDLSTITLDEIRRVLGS